MSRLVLHTDGGARGNPGPAAIGVVVEDAEKGGVLAEIGERIGVATNNVAEYRALIRGLEEAARLGGSELQCLLDSQLVVEQMSGRYRVRHDAIAPLHRQATGLAAGFERVTYAYVPRAQNAEADRLVNAALDGKPVAAGTPAGEREAEASPRRSTSANGDEPRRHAMDLIRESYYSAAHMVGSDLEAVNRSRPPGMRYQSEEQLVREFLLMAGAQADFAVRVGLIEPDDLRDFLREYWAEQKDLIDEENEAWIQQSLDLGARER